MDGMLALTIVCVVFAIGDFISDKTHAIIPYCSSPRSRS